LDETSSVKRCDVKYFLKYRMRLGGLATPLVANDLQNAIEEARREGRDRAR
jgi:hypothetical protein